MGHEISLSEAISKIASELFLIPHFAGHDEKDLTCSSLAQVVGLVDACSPEMSGRGGEFARTGNVNDVVAIRGISYPSAHHAAFGEAVQFLDQLWFNVDHSGYAAMRDGLLAKSKVAIDSGRAREDDPEGTATVCKLNNGTGINLAAIGDNWERTKAVILELLDQRWQQDFKTIGSRIIRERAATKPQAKAIPPEFRTVVMNKRRAASILHPGNPDSGVEWLNQCIAEGTISCETLSRQSHVFDLREFPKSVLATLRPK